MLNVESFNSRKMVKIGIWNVQSLYEAGKLTNEMSEMKRLLLDVLGITETWWPNVGICAVQGGIMYYSGSQDKNHRRGVEIIVGKKLIDPYGLRKRNNRGVRVYQFCQEECIEVTPGLSYHSDVYIHGVL